MQINYAYQIKPSSKELPADGPAPLIISIANASVDTVTVFGNKDDFLSLSFQTPGGWAAKEREAFDEIMGILPSFKLSPGEVVLQTVFLHDFFSGILPGNVKLPVTISFWEERNSERKQVIHTETCNFKILEHQEKEFGDRIHIIHQQIISAKDAAKRLKLYQSLTNLEHPELVTIFLEALLDVNMLVFHHTARMRLTDLSQKYGNRDALIGHLSKYGSRYDAYFFQLWKERGIELTEIEIERLAESTSLWIRVFCLENYPGPYNRNGVMQSLKTEINELQKRVQKLH